MPYRYDVRHAFAHEGRVYSRGNADEIPGLPRRVRDHQIAQGHIVEHHDPPERVPEPTAPASTSSTEEE